MKVEVEGTPTYQGVRTDHPDIIAAIQNLTKLGYGAEHIIRVVGMPGEVVRKYMAKVK